MDAPAEWISDAAEDTVITRAERRRWAMWGGLGLMVGAILAGAIFWSGSILRPPSSFGERFPVLVGCHGRTLNRVSEPDQR